MDFNGTLDSMFLLTPNKNLLFPAQQHLINAYHDLNYSVIIGSFCP
jgi:hypothetical protein